MGQCKSQHTRPRALQVLHTHTHTRARASRRRACAYPGMSRVRVSGGPLCVPCERARSVAAAGGCLGTRLASRATVTVAGPRGA